MRQLAEPCTREGLLCLTIFGIYYRIVPA